MRKFLLLLTATSLMLQFSSCKKDEPDPDPETNNSATQFNSESKVATVDGNDVSYEQVTIKDLGKGTGSVTLTKNKVYKLDGFVFVNAGQTLTIEAGTIIKGASGQSENASALVVANGAKIEAVGTSSEPIVMTSINDPVIRDKDGALFAEGTDLETVGLWGGLIVLGDAQLNSTPGTSQIEGIPSAESRGIYGGTNDAHDGGTLKYISIRYGGSNIGANNEINGLTLGGVGTNTEIDYIEVFRNQDDGVEFFGGHPNTKHLLTVYCEDDAFDYDEGFRGYGQYWATLLSPDSDHAGEHDGGTDPEDGTPYAIPTIYNATYVGNSTSRPMILRDNAGGKYYNSIFTDFTFGISIEDLTSGQDARARLEAGDLAMIGNVMFDVDGIDDPTTLNVTEEYLFAYVDKDKVFTADAQTEAAISGNSTEDPGFAASSLVPTNTLSTGAPSTATSGWFTFDNVTYKGAFANGQTAWYDGWTISSKVEILK